MLSCVPCANALPGTTADAQRKITANNDRIDPSPIARPSPSATRLSTYNQSPAFIVVPNNTIGWEDGAITSLQCCFPERVAAAILST